MIETLNILYSRLDKIKVNLRKLGSTRRTEEVIKKSILEAREIFEKYEKVVLELNKSIKDKKFTDEILIQITEIGNNITSTYNKILSYKVTSVEMDKFDLKTAVNLIPVMNDDEKVTLQLIDSIELYDTMLDAEGKTRLINFVLKTRLSAGAKLRLNRAYSSVSVLLSDMKKHLITKKSDTALQSRLQSARQNQQTVAEFGAEIEQLFTELTLAQAEDNTEAFTILKTVNEKNAIKRFAEGLRSQKLSTIISARNFSSLKDAIRVAQDEEIGSSQQVMSYSTRARGFGRTNRRSFGRARSGFRGTYTHYDNSQSNPNANRGNNYSNNRRGSGGRNRSRGRSNNRGRRTWHNAFPVEETKQPSTSTINYAQGQNQENNTESLNHFFRE